MTAAKKKNMDLYLGEVFKQFIAIKDEDYTKSQQVFTSVFDQVKQKMGENCNYFAKYGTQKMFAGSVYDGIKVTKLDEFDMDIVIRLPINYDEGITVESDQPGFVKLKIESAFDLLDKQQDWEKCHKVTRDWRDSDKYLLQNKFRQWMHAIVQKALNDLDGKVVVNDVTYIVKYKESGPAYTLNVQNDKDNEEFKLDVDLVPVIRFQHPRWPEGYRMMEDTTVKDWLVVPKPNKSLKGKMQNQCWRLSFQEFERDMMKNCQQLKTTIRLVKKLRDRLQMKDIASYYIKTLFLWKISREDKKYWQTKLSVTFRDMVEELYKAIEAKEIKYFWNDGNNLIEGLKPTIKKVYAEKLKEVIDSFDANNTDKIVSYLLTTDELQVFKKSEFYEKQTAAAAAAVVNPASLITSRQSSVASNKSDTTDSAKCQPEKNDNPVLTLLKTINQKIDALNAKSDRQTERLKKLETAMGIINGTFTDKLDSQNERIKMLEMAHKEQNSLNNSINNLKIGHNDITL